MGLTHNTPPYIVHRFTRTGSRASAELAICTACVEGCWAEPRALLHALHHYALQAKITLTNFNLPLSTQTTKLSNLIPCHIFQLYSMISTWTVYVLICTLRHSRRILLYSDNA